MIEGVIELGDVVVSHIMTPRTEVYMVQLETPWNELVEDLIESGHSRVPAPPDRITGINIRSSPPSNFSHPIVAVTARALDALN